MVDPQSLEIETVEVYTIGNQENYEVPLGNFHMKGGMIYLVDVGSEEGDDVRNVMLPESSIDHITEIGYTVEEVQEDRLAGAEPAKVPDDAERDENGEAVFDEEDDEEFEAAREEAAEAAGENLTEKKVDDLKDLVPEIGRVDILEAALEADDRVTAQELYEDRIAELTDD